MRASSATLTWLAVVGVVRFAGALLEFRLKVPPHGVELVGDPAGVLGVYHQVLDGRERLLRGEAIGIRHENEGARKGQDLGFGGKLLDAVKQASAGQGHLSPGGAIEAVPGDEQFRVIYEVLLCGVMPRPLGRAISTHRGLHCKHHSARA